AEAEPDADRFQYNAQTHFTRVDETIAHAALYVAQSLDLRALVALTESGTTALYMSRRRTEIPVYALTPHATTRRRVTLYRGVHPVPVEHSDRNGVDEVRAAVRALLTRGAVAPPDLLLITHGKIQGASGGTNSL